MRIRVVDSLDSRQDSMEYMDTIQSSNGHLRPSPLLNPFDESIHLSMQIVDELVNMSDDCGQFDFHRNISHTCCHVQNKTCMQMMTACKGWLDHHEEAQVMFASVLVLIGLWWLVRALLCLLMGLVCPVLVVFLAVASLFIYLFFAVALGSLCYKWFGMCRLK